MDELVEKIARALIEAVDGDGDRVLRHNDWMHVEAQAPYLAFAVLAVIDEAHAIVPKEPTEAMLEPFGIHRSRMAENYRAMIEAASPQSPPANP